MNERGDKTKGRGERKKKKRRGGKREVSDRIYENWNRMKGRIPVRDGTKVDFHGVDVRLIIYPLSGVDGLGNKRGCTVT